MKNQAARLVMFLALTCIPALGAPFAHAQIQVNGANPNNTTQGTVNLNVIVSGSGFKKGAKAQWFVTGTTNPGGVTVNSTAFNNSGQLTANITVAADAVIANFDILVTNTDGRTGKGTELFAVKTKTASGCPTLTPLNPAPASIACSSASGQTCLDATFGNPVQLPPGGLVVTNTDGSVPSTSDLDYASAVKQQPDGKLVAIGTTSVQNSASPYGAAVIRYNWDGTLDTSFGSGGIAKFFSPLNMGLDIRDGAIDSAGNILAVGFQNNSVAFLLRFTPAGVLDTSFNASGTPGYLTISNFIAYTLRLQADGKVVLGGITISNKNQIGLVVRVNTNGSLDTTFGSSGQVALSSFHNLRAITLQTVNSQQDILAGGNSASANITVSRLNPSGSLDATFGTSGVATTLFCGGYTSNIQTLSVDPLGNILAGGSTEVVSSGPQKFAIERLTSSGILDTSFGDPSTIGSGRTGQTLLDFFGSGNNVNSTQFLLDASGNQIGFVVGGFASNATGNSYLVLAKYHSDGSLDTTFGANGGVAIDFGNGNSSGTFPGNNNTLIQIDGKLVIVGTTVFSTGPYTGYNFALARLWP